MTVHRVTPQRAAAGRLEYASRLADAERLPRGRKMMPGSRGGEPSLVGRAHDARHSHQLNRGRNIGPYCTGAMVVPGGG